MGVCRPEAAPWLGVSRARRATAPATLSLCAARAGDRTWDVPSQRCGTLASWVDGVPGATRPVLNGMRILPGLVPAWRTGRAPCGAAPPPPGGWAAAFPAGLAALTASATGARQPQASRGARLQPCSGGRVDGTWGQAHRPLSLTQPVAASLWPRSGTARPTGQGQLSPTGWSPPVPETGNRWGTGGASQSHTGTPGLVREPGTRGQGPLLGAPREDAGEAGRQAQWALGPHPWWSGACLG